MKRIYKYNLEVVSCGETQRLDLPIGFKILSVQEQDGKITLWAEVNPENIEKPRRFLVYGTGWALDAHWDNFISYIGTVQINSLVWHIYME